MLSESFMDFITYSAGLVCLLSVIAMVVTWAIYRRKIIQMNALVEQMLNLPKEQVVAYIWVNTYRDECGEHSDCSLRVKLIGQDSEFVINSDYLIISIWHQMTKAGRDIINIDKYPGAKVHTISTR